MIFSIFNPPYVDVVLVLVLVLVAALSIVADPTIFSCSSGAREGYDSEKRFFIEYHNRLL